MNNKILERWALNFEMESPLRSQRTKLSEGRPAWADDNNCQLEAAKQFHRFSFGNDGKQIPRHDVCNLFAGANSCLRCERDELVWLVGRVWCLQGRRLCPKSPVLHGKHHPACPDAVQLGDPLWPCALCHLRMQWERVRNRCRNWLLGISARKKVCSFPMNCPRFFWHCRACRGVQVFPFDRCNDTDGIKNYQHFFELDVDVVGLHFKFSGNAPRFVAIQKGGPEEIAPTKANVLLLCWPPRENLCNEEDPIPHDHPDFGKFFQVALFLFDPKRWRRKSFGRGLCQEISLGLRGWLYYLCRRKIRRKVQVFCTRILSFSCCRAPQFLFFPLIFTKTVFYSLLPRFFFPQRFHRDRRTQDDERGCPPSISSAEHFWQLVDGFDLIQTVALANWPFACDDLTVWRRRRIPRSPTLTTEIEERVHSMPKRQRPKTPPRPQADHVSNKEIRRCILKIFRSWWAEQCEENTAAEWSPRPPR